MQVPLFRRVMGAAFESLPPRLRAIHDGVARTLVGRCEVMRGTGVFSRLCAMVASLPRAGKSVALRVSITPSARGEIWERVFDGKPMTSSLRDRGGLLEESFGPAVLRFALEATPESIAWKLVAVRTFGIPLPIAWFDKVHAHESLDGETYRFDVRAELPLTGLLVHYRGTLDAGA